MSHYFINDAGLEHKHIEITFCFNGRTFVFKSDAGVFSSKKPDSASVLLLKSIPELSGALLDLGCGYGLTGIVLNARNNLKLTQTDINARAVFLTKLNAGKNRVASDVFLSDGFENITDSFDAIALNPPVHAGKKTVYGLFEGSFAHLRANGALYTVMLKKHGAYSAVKKLAQLFGNCEIINKKAGIICFRSVKT